MKCEEEDEEQDEEDEEMYDELDEYFQRVLLVRNLCKWKSESESDFLFICKVTTGKMGNDFSDESMRLFIG